MLACTHTHILDILLYSTYMTLYVQWKQSVCMHITLLYIHPFRIPPRPLYIPTPQRKVRERIQSMSIPSNICFVWVDAIPVTCAPSHISTQCNPILINTSFIWVDVHLIHGYSHINTSFIWVACATHTCTLIVMLLVHVTFVTFDDACPAAVII